ncbi:MAG: septum formation inhibitor Maf [Christensenellaceae bacterium]|nr:septum formation inhibitor Maf [Christensenellaceae bacterium]
MRLVLASGSQRRRELLTMCGYDFDIVVSDADESITETDPEKLVSALALRKASEVYSRLHGENMDDELVVVGSDTVVSFDGCIIGKPKDERDAVRILTMLSGKTHHVYTGVAVITAEQVQIECDVTEVTFKELSESEIEAYVASGEPMDKAGAYGIQGSFGMFVERIAGNYFTVIGMPLPRLYRMLKSVGVLPKNFQNTPTL